MTQIDTINSDFAVFISMFLGLLFIIFCIALIIYKFKKQERRDKEYSKMLGSRYQELKDIAKQSFTKKMKAEGVAGLFVKYIDVTDCQDTHFTVYIGARGQLKANKHGMILEYWTFEHQPNGDWQVIKVDRIHKLRNAVIFGVLLLLVLFGTITILAFVARN